MKDHGIFPYRTLALEARIPDGSTAGPSAIGRGGVAALLCCLLLPACLRTKGAAAAPPDPYELLQVEENRTTTAAFVLDGKPLCFQGTNNYYLIYKSRRMVDDIFVQAKAMNLKVLRLWAFLDRGSLDGSVPSIDGDGTKDGVYFRFWDPVAQQPVINDGENGLQRLDYVLTQARRHDVRLILVLTNNWREFGGIDQYVTWYRQQGAKYHDDFFTHPGIRQAYKDYAAHLIDRVNSIDGMPYRDDPAIFAWELANEPRCRNGRDLDRADGWDTTTLVRWAEEMSAFIRSRDPNHLIAVGDEGFLAGGGSSWIYEAQDGVDHQALAGVEHVDFATFHLYPDHWGLSFEQGYRWIEAHLEVARRVGKPTILEEYGTIVQREPTSFELTWGWERRQAAYRNWNELMRKRGGSGSMFWMLAGVDDRFGTYPDYDGFQVYQGLPTAELLTELAQQHERHAAACKYAVDVSDVPASPFVQVKRLPPEPAAATEPDPASVEKGSRG